MSSQPVHADNLVWARTVRTLAGALMGALLMILVVVTMVLSSTDGAFDFNPVPLGIQVVAGLGAHFLLEQIGYRVPALDLSDSAPSDATSSGRARTSWQSAMLLRFAVCESIAILSIAAAFILEGGFFILLGGVVVSLALMAVHVWPQRRSVDRVATALEAGGARSGLRETFGYSADGPIQRL